MRRLWSVILWLLTFGALALTGNPAAAQQKPKDTGTPVSEDYRAPFKFTGTLAKVVIDLTPEPLSAEDEQKLKEGRAAIGVAR